MNKPINPWMMQAVRIASIQREIDEVFTLHLELTDSRLADEYRFAPGQFNMLYVPGCGEVAISMSGPSDGGGSLVHTIRAVGRVTEVIMHLQVGAELGMRGPYGTSWPIDLCAGRDVILMAGGIGLAPLRPVIYALLARPEMTQRKVLLMGARSPQGMLYEHEFQTWQRQGLEVITTVDRADETWQGYVGVVPKLLDQLPGVQPDRSLVMTCGPEIMMHYSALGAIDRGIAPESIWVSLERHMQCAVGFCGHCQLGPAFVCKDGPVFRYDKARELMQVKEW